MYRRISPDRIKEIRGDRTRRAVIEPVRDNLTEQELMAYEKGLYRPSEKKLPYLLKGLGCSYDDISFPVELAAR